MSDRTKSITAFEAKTRLGKLLDRVQAGEEVVITRHGQAVAKIVPMQDQTRAEREAAFERLAQLRKQLRDRGVKVSRREIRAWIIAPAHIMQGSTVQ